MDEEKKLTDEIEEKFRSLPEDIRELIYSSDMSSIIECIAEKHGLHVDQMGTLMAETASVMTGFSDPNKFTSELMEELQIDQSKAKAIAEDINNDLFTQIRESLKQLYGKERLIQQPFANGVQIHKPSTELVAKTDTPVQVQEKNIPLSYKTDPYREPVE